MIKLDMLCDGRIFLVLFNKEAGWKGWVTSLHVHVARCRDAARQRQIPDKIKLSILV